MATVNCHNCGYPGDDMDGACEACGQSLYGDVASVFDNGPNPPKKGVSSSGRYGTDPVSRARFLETAGDRREAAEDDDGGAWLRALLRDVRETEAALQFAQWQEWQAEEEYRTAREDFPEAATAGYDMSGPSARSRFLRFRESDTALEHARDHTRARRAEHDRAVRRLENLDSFGLSVAPTLSDDGDDGSIAWAQKRAEATRQHRLNPPGARGWS